MMKRFMTITAMLALGTGMMMAQDGGTLFKAKCAMCHGPNGEGKMGPKIAGTDPTSVLTNGGKKGPHGAKFAGLTDDQIKAIATYVQGLK